MVVSSLSSAQIYLSSSRSLFQNRYPAVLNLFVSQPGLPRKTFFLHVPDNTQVLRILLCYNRCIRHNRDSPKNLPEILSDIPLSFLAVIYRGQSGALPFSPSDRSTYKNRRWLFYCLRL